MPHVASTRFDFATFLSQGDAALKLGKFAEAALYFDKAQEQCQNLDKATVYGRSALAHTGNKCFDRGLANSTAASKLEPDNVRILHVKGFCEDALGLYRQSAETFASAAKQCAGDAELAEACADGLRTALRHLKEQTDGKYDWVGLHTSGVRVASFCRPCEVRFVSDYGRGLVLREDVAEGSLLFATKAFVMGLRSKILSDTVEKLQTCSQVEFDRFFCLYDGSNSDQVALNMEGPPCSAPPEPEPKAQEREVNVAHVRRILNFNQHTRTTLGDVRSEVDDRTCGLWPVAAFMNHSCRPNVVRTFVGDMFVCRAARQLKAGTELLDHYVSLTQPLHIRRSNLKKYEFHCNCARCTLEELVPAEEATSMMQQAESLQKPSECKDPDLAKKSAGRLESFVAAVEKKIHACMIKNRAKLQTDLVLQGACAQLWGTTLGMEGMLPHLECMLCASFLQYSLWVAVAWKQLADPSKTASGFGRCCDQMAEILPNSELHCYMSAELATHIHLASRRTCRHGQNWSLRDAQDAAHNAYFRHACCYSEELWQTQAKDLSWPHELLIAASPGWKCQCAKATNEVTSSPYLVTTLRWDSSISEVDGFLWITVQIPPQVQMSDVELEINDHELLVRCAEAGTSQKPLRVAWTNSVDSSRAPPAQFRKRLRQLVLQLPLIMS